MSLSTPAVAFFLVQAFLVHFLHAKHRTRSKNACRAPELVRKSQFVDLVHWTACGSVFQCGLLEQKGMSCLKRAKKLLQTDGIENLGGGVVWIPTVHLRTF